MAEAYAYAQVHPPDGREAPVLDLARQLRETAPDQAKDPQSLLQTLYDVWRAAIVEKVQHGELAAPEVKSFARKVQQAVLLQMNMTADQLALAGSKYHDAAVARQALVSVADSGATAETVCEENPLTCVPRLARGPSLQEARSRGIKTAQVTIGDPKTGTASGEARTDAVVVFCPGVVRTNVEFGAQGKAALELGFSSTRAETGTFLDAEVNAEAVAAAVKQGKDRVKNPKAKAILVGYSQGNTNLYAFLRNKAGRWKDLIGDVIAVHDMHSAANGSRFADLAFAVGAYLGKDAEPSSDDLRLLGALYRAEAKNWNVPERDLEAASQELRKIFHDLRADIAAVEKFGKPVLQKLGLHGLGEEELGRKLLGLFLRGENLTEHFVQQGGMAGHLAAKLLDPVWSRLTSSKARRMLTDGPLHELLQIYVNGGLRSLSTPYGTELMTDAPLQQNLAKVFILNSVGAVPVAREMELVPKSQRLNYVFFNELRMDNDYQVALADQKLEWRLKNAVDCYTQAIGHWGVAGVLIPVDHPATYFKDFSPPGLTRAALITLGELGIV